ncbi:MAG: PilZ domain-containing protein [Myxococcota bacterium]
MLEPQITHDTWLSPVMFKDGSDRRDGARIPKALKVRLGPPKAAPETTLLSEDLSTGGLFIRCAEPVQIGARFSLEIAVENGEPIYIPEAEVLYNYTAEDGQKRGFGARFCSVTKEAHERLLDAARFSSDLRVIEDERPEVSDSMILNKSDAAEHQTSRVKKAGIDLTKAVPILPRVSDLRLATERPKQISAIISLRPDMIIKRKKPVEPVLEPEVSDTMIPEAAGEETMPPMMAEPALSDTPSPMPLEGHTISSVSDIHAGIPEVPREVRARRGRGLLDRLTDRVGEQPLLWVGGAAMVLGAGLVFFLNGTPKSHPAAASQERAIPAADLAALEKAAAPVRAMDATSEPTRKIEPGLLGAVQPAAAPAPMAEVKAEPKKKASAQKAEAPKVEPVKAVPVKLETPKVEPAKAEAAKPSDKLEALDRAVAKVVPAEGTAKIALSIEGEAKVVRTHSLKAPNRFVVDVAGLSSAPKAQKGAAGLDPRVGKHEDYYRIVIDTPFRVGHGEATVSGKTLTISVSK